MPSPVSPVGPELAAGRGLRIGLQLPEVERHVPWPEYLAMARAAEEVGFDSVWVGDHLLYRADGREARGPWDAWSVLAAIAGTTERVRLGPLVACTAFAAPGLLARKAAAVQEISGGRLVLGIGAGWNETEFRAFGVPFDHRAARFAESFEIIRRLLAGERVTYEGRFERVRDAVLLPMPDTRPPLMIGSTGERVLRTALPHADAWNIWYDGTGTRRRDSPQKTPESPASFGKPADDRPTSCAARRCSSRLAAAGAIDLTPGTCAR
jgi:alkanesulfonate monooxygenase SsuD/methylene tetrahydromethanopterin reductase-like flavin-dependent oxidoreductase (luciferase family)